MSVLINYGKRELDRNPCEGKRLPEPKTKLTTLTYSDAAKMIGAVNQQAPHTVDLIDLGCQTGASLSDRSHFYSLTVVISVSRRVSCGRRSGTTATGL